MAACKIIKFANQILIPITKYDDIYYALKVEHILKMKIKDKDLKS